MHGSLTLRGLFNRCRFYFWDIGSAKFSKLLATNSDTIPDKHSDHLARKSFRSFSNEDLEGVSFLDFYFYLTFSRDFFTLFITDTRSGSMCSSLTESVSSVLVSFFNL